MGKHGSALVSDRERCHKDSPWSSSPSRPSIEPRQHAGSAFAAFLLVSDLTSNAYFVRKDESGFQQHDVRRDFRKSGLFRRW